MLDFKTVENQISKIKSDFNVDEIIFVGDRGMRMRYNLDNMTDDAKTGVKYISGLTTDEIKKLEKDEVIQLSFFDKELVEIEDGNKRYILCVNPILEQEKKAKRAERKLKFEVELAALQSAYNKKVNDVKTTKRE
ncbi:MAG: hypothetical protein OMM_13901 [Candidatus Magnetoglobus multicellularis str. Araruama]|uniref:Uncharacterized protein n=1 Tax=Candidatus Magnetoglobus multicellularis str. Araruama TaxID=890399 RepID=A0A1V1NSX6_9BACT|nr:MAG: hypothetical protein OMM_13901 [Candidatus Magnetoglobus multicellularis str. Araruama]